MTLENVLPGDELATVMAERGYPAVEPATTRDRGEGPFERLVLRGARLIDGTGAPPAGPFDIVVEGGKITEMVIVGTPKMPINPARRPAKGDREIDCTGKVVTPGFVDAHVHIGTYFHAAAGPMPPADYVYKLWLAHGITTVREMACMNGVSWTMEQKQAAAEHRIAAPNIVAHAYVPVVDEFIKTLHTPDQARDWVRAVRERGIDGLKFFGAPPAIMQAALEEANALGMASGCHHAQMTVARTNSLKSAQWGLTSTEHFYGVPEAMFEDRAIQSYPVGYDYMDESLRYNWSSQNFVQAAEPGSKKWVETLEAYLELGHTFVPTLAILEANRDLMRARRADWHDAYTHKTVWDYFQPNRGGHCSHWYRWNTTNEVQWKEHFRRWMRFCNDYKNMGGRVVPGSDAGFTFQIYGFCFIRELEQMQEAGFHPLEIFRAATSESAALLGVGDHTGTIAPGMDADILVHDHDPLEDLKYLYGTGAMRLNDDTRKTEWHRGIKYTIKGGVIYDVAELLSDVRDMVRDSFEGAEEDTRPRLPK
ncbi:MAG: amidohydrolase family protein [Pseudomonadota bacterium]|nr:amidohydrolase family protein [Pseudomonadota bacterium]